MQKKEHGRVLDKSFTADTKRECEAMAVEWLNTQPDEKVFTVRQAITLYMDAHKPILSPSTIRGYNSCITRLKPLYEVDTAKISSTDLQTFVSQMAIDGSSPKTIRNVYGFLISVLAAVHPEKHYNVTLPKRERRETTVPTEKQIKMMLDSAPDDLRLAMLLGVCSLRRGEVCALKYGDVSKDMKMVRVHADIVYAPSCEWVYKDKAKTVESNRAVLVPQEVIDMIGAGDPDAFIFSFTPAMLTKRFNQLRDSFGFDCRFHDLRAFSASFMHYLNIPEQYILSQGGWSNNGVMQSIYRTSLADKRGEFSKVANDYISKTLLS